MTHSSQIIPRWLFFVCTGLWLCSLVSCAPPAPPCRNDGDCSGAAPYCISGACRECKGSKDCASQKCRSSEVCDPSEPISKESLTEASQEPALEPVSSSDADAAESSSESETEVKPEPVPTPVCANGTTRACYPAGKNGCSAGTGGKYTCKGICTTGTESCVGGEWSGKCSGATEPTTELCNGKDDDCDGVIDNGFANLGQPCDVGQGECKATGKYVCKGDGSGTECDAKPGTPTGEICDKKDNNCNGSVDEGCPCVLGDTQACGSDKGECKKGTQTCDQNGKWGACSGEVKAATEVCNGKDDDCDGVIDNGFANLGQTCNMGQGECKTTGKYVCKIDGSGTECNTKPGTPGTEVCDGKDNDCNGKIDDIADLSQTCTDTNRKGICQAGVWECANNQKVCKQSVQASTEKCNGKDDDCDGQIDNGFANLGQPCDAGQGECRTTGKNVCKSDGSGTECDVKASQATTEVCDGKDNDCNGKIDDIADLSQTCTDTNRKGVCQAGIWGCVNNQKVCKQTVQASSEVCGDGLDNNCDGGVDEGCPCSYLNNTFGVCKGGKLDGMNLCLKPDQYSVIEICGDNLDNNCNGVVDEGCPCNYLGRSVGVCINATLDNNGLCQPPAGYSVTEICDGKDNNCNGQIDDIIEIGQICADSNRKGVCQAGMWECINNQKVCKQTIQASNELCDGKDNDCDGQIDNGFANIGQFCDMGQGECKATGKYVCKSDGSGTECDAKSGTPKMETCNGKDDDCDGQIDNGFANIGQSCDDGQGECKATGKYVCKTDGSGTECDAKAGTPGTEICDSKDNDCNGKIDDITEAGQICTDTNRKGECQTGVWECSGNLKICRQTIQPTNEVCNGKDDNCDGQIDNDCGFLWATFAGGIAYDEAYNTAIDISGNLYITGYYTGTATFGMTTLTSKGSTDIFVAKLNNQGTFLWASSAGGGGSDRAINITIDSSGNLYITGAYNGTAMFGATTMTSHGSNDIFVAKLNNQGSFLWASSAGGSGFDYGRSITIDNSGNIYITGYFSETAMFGTTTLTSKGVDDIFVTKLSNQGAFLWASSAGSSGYDFASFIAIDRSENLYIAGFYSGIATFGTATLTSKGGYNIFIAKLSNQGSFLWASSAGGTEPAEARSIAIDSTDNLYIAGYYSGTATFGVTTLTSKGSNEIFVAKLSNQGSFLWASSAGGIESDIAYGMVIDSSNNLYITGYYSGTATFDTFTLTSKGARDIFIAKLSNQGSFQWVTSAGGAASDEAYNIAIDSVGGLYLAGYYSGTAAFGTTTLTSKGQYDAFVAKFR